MVKLSRRETLVSVPRPGAVVPLSARPAENADLQTLYNRYRALSSRLAPDLIETQDMARARAALIQALLDDGWKAPELVRDRLRADKALLRPKLEVAS
jgi:hypothetical protein